MADSDAIILVVDDDVSVRDALGGLIRWAGLRVETFASAQEFLARPPTDAPGCLVLDVGLPGLDGLELQKRMAEKNLEIPIIFITGHGDVPTSVQAMKAGALDFLIKPFAEQDLLDAIQRALKRDRAARQQQAKIRELHSRYQSLTPREREVMERVVSGVLNKQIAAELGKSVITVKAHRPGYAENASRLFGGPGENVGDPRDTARDQIVGAGSPCPRPTRYQGIYRSFFRNTAHSANGESSPYFGR